MIHAYIYVDGDENYELMAPFDVLPRVGEIVTFEFAAYDTERWDMGVFDRMTLINGSEYVVKKIVHAIRRNSVDSWGSHIVELIVDRVPK